MMLIQNVELGSVLKIRGNTITFKDTNQFEEREYQVEQSDVEELVWITGMDSEDAAMLLGKIEEIRIHSSPRKRLFKKIDSKKLIDALANIILEYNWQDIYQYKVIWYCLRLCKSPVSQYGRKSGEEFAPEMFSSLPQSHSDSS